MRGEDGLSASFTTKRSETPPRAWGRHHVHRVGGQPGGNTPTCVGKTESECTGISRAKKHPHVRGEDGKSLLQTERPIETPPRAWGRHVDKELERDKSRNTPTCVGKTNATPLSLGITRKHPHVRGEDTSSCVRSERYVETPPRAWGRPRPVQRGRARPRNTPTCVGKTNGCRG